MAPNDRTAKPEFHTSKLSEPTERKFASDWLEALAKYRGNAIVLPPRSRPRETTFR